MLRTILARGMFYWLRAPRNYADVRRDEWALARARLLISAACLLAIFWLMAHRNPTLNWKLPLAYFIYSLLILLTLRIFPRWNPKYHMAVHFADILWAAQLTVLTGWPAIFFALVIFIMASSGARWGFWEALLTAFSLLLAVFLTHFVYHPSISHALNFVVELEFFPAGLLCLALVFAYGLLGESRATRAENSAIARILQGTDLETGFEKALHHMAKEGMPLLGALQTLVVIDDRGTSQCSIYRITGPQATLESGEILPQQRGQYFFQPPASSWSVGLSRIARQPTYRCLLLDSERLSRDRSGFKMPDAFVATHPFRTLLAVALPLRDTRSIRVFLIDPFQFYGGAAGLRFVDSAVRQAAPILDDLFLISRVRTEAEAEAIGKIARDIHDGAIQSLAAINLQLEQVHRLMASITSEGADSLAAIQTNIQAEIAALRELTQQMRALEVDSEHLLGFLASLAVRFQSEHGIVTRFVPEVDEIRLRAEVCCELARIAQEALVNIRKHGKASEVFIRLARDNGNYVLGVVDNGRGFDFTGRYSHKELLASGKGPSVIMERARKIRAEVTIESIPGTGSYLEVALPDGSSKT